jgi:hypothetical protein
MELHLRTALVAAGVVVLAGWIWSAWSGRAGRPTRARRSLRKLLWEHLHETAETQYRSCLALVVGSFLLIATVAKHSQLHALALNAEDFWLFEDMLAQMMRGGFFITRYAPQALGWVQHGAVHPMLSWVFALPLAYVVGPTLAAVAFGPLVFSGAGLALAAIARPRWGTAGALAIAAAFLASSQLGKVLMYDVHPEAAYPLGVLLWAWAAGWGDGKLRVPALLFATIFTAGIKEDSFAVLLPLIAATAWVRCRPELKKLWPLKKPARPANVIALRPKKSEDQAEIHPPSSPALLQWLGACAILAIGVTAFQFAAVHQWSSGAWGPSQWQGQPVAIPRGAELMRNRHWDTPASALAILGDLIAQRGGIVGAVGSFFKFLISRPWISLLALAPWVVTRSGFWISVLPLAAIYSVLDDPGKFINYYSAPVLGTFWLAAICYPPRKARKRSVLLWLLSLSLVLGGGGIVFYQSTQLTRQTRDEIQALAACLPAQSHGMVTGPFIGLVPAEKIATDRVAPDRPLESVDFYLFSTSLPSYEVGPAASQVLLTRLSKDPRWIRLGVECQPVGENAKSADFLFLRR